MYISRRLICFSILLILFANICHVYAASVIPNKSIASAADNNNNNDNGNDDNSNDDEDDDDYYNSTIDDNQNDSNSTILNQDFVPQTQDYYTKTKSVLKSFEESCPKPACDCDDDEKSVICSRTLLKEVPKELPTKSLIIDLSYNLIKRIEENDFSNCSQVRHIDLSFNQISFIHIDAFNGLHRLQVLRLDNNKLTQIDPNLFIGSTSLLTLNLSSNYINLRDEGSFLNQPILKNLYCQNCSWTELYDDTFKNLNQLTSLRLDENDFEQQINTNAFKNTPNLIELRLSDLHETYIQELCTTLKFIDSITLKNFSVSCFELVLGTSFDESKIFNSDDNYATYTTLKTTTKKPELQLQDQPIARPSTSNKMNFSISNLNATSVTEAINLTPINSTITPSVNSQPEKNENEEEAVYQVPVSEAAIKIMLISIMIIAFIGIVIGVICRKDIGGIKTKCCRTKRPEVVKDPVHPTEEIPLNTLA